MRVKIAFVTGPDGQVDKGRVGKIEEWPDADAKRLIKEGIATRATDQDIEDYEARRAYERGVAEAERAADDADEAAAVEGEKADRAETESTATEPAATAKGRRNGATATQPATAGSDDPADPDGQ